MGANCATQVAEGLSSKLALLTMGRPVAKIVSNFMPERATQARFKISLDKLGYKGFSGSFVAERMIEAYEWADLDVHRAATHNKGIFF